MSDQSDFCIGCMNDEYPEGLRKEIESLSQQLEELKVNHKAELVMRDQNSQMYLDNTRKQLAEAEALRVCADHDANELAKQLAESQAEAERYKAAWESSHGR